MIIKCFRDGKEIDSPNDKNADYIMAQDTIVKEPRDTLRALVHNPATRAIEVRMAMTEEYFDDDGVTVLTRKKFPGLAIPDSVYDAIEVDSPKSARAYGNNLVRVSVTVEDKNIQKTGIICPDCYRPSDFVIWGVHKVTP